MVAEGHTVASLTGGIEGSQRDAVIDQFRAGQAKVLITTNVLARGIDVSTVSMVINYVSLHPMTGRKDKLNHFYRISPKSINLGAANARPISRPTSTVSAVPDDSAVWVFRSRSSPAATNGTCSTRFNNISTPASSASTPRTGTRWKTSSRRPSKPPELREPSGDKIDQSDRIASCGACMCIFLTIGNPHRGVRLGGGGREAEFRSRRRSNFFTHEDFMRFHFSTKSHSRYLLLDTSFNILALVIRSTLARLR